MAIERHKAIYEGRVQGVGFRMTAKRLASGFATSGFVRNLPDGRVELVAEGEADVVASFLREVLREFGDMIHDDQIDQEPPMGEVSRVFTIHYDASTA